ncbi:hypothetical protein PTI98_006940 [Pleurotus ostreatus]|nr:hypothetical protein PTI98_006940 [Pleurotus ostreatus]
MAAACAPVIKPSLHITTPGGRVTRKICQWVTPMSPTTSDSGSCCSDGEIPRCHPDEDEDTGIVYIARRVRVTLVRGTLVRVQRS